MKFAHRILFFSIVGVLFSAAFPVTIRTAELEIKLPTPQYSSNTSVEKALKERRSIRGYKNLPISLPDLSQLLWASQGLTGPGGMRTAPSAGALYPLEVYVVVGNVSGLPAGIYLYKPEGHRLIKIADGDKRAELSRAALRQPAIKAAAAVLVIAGIYERTTVKYGE